MLYKVKVEVHSYIHMKHTNTMWAQCRIVEC